MGRKTVIQTQSSAYRGTGKTWKLTTKRKAQLYLDLVPLLVLPTPKQIGARYGITREAVVWHMRKLRKYLKVAERD